MVVPVGTAINAYKNVAAGIGSGDQAASSETVPGTSFGDFLQASIGNTIDTLHKSEDVSGAALVGKASAADVVMAVNQAQVSMKEFVKIRDQVISAYEDIIKMPI